MQWQHTFICPDQNTLTVWLAVRDVWVFANKSQIPICLPLIWGESWFLSKVQYWYWVYDTQWMPCRFIPLLPMHSRQAQEDACPKWVTLNTKVPSPIFRRHCVQWRDFQFWHLQPDVVKWQLQIVCLSVVTVQGTLLCLDIVSVVGRVYVISFACTMYCNVCIDIYCGLFVLLLYIHTHTYIYIISLSPGRE